MARTKPADADDPNVKVFTLGDLGVNLTTSPLHVTPGELSSAQNAVFSLIRAKHGISKRPGMTKMNASAAAGAVRAFQSIPIADPSLAQAAGDDVANGLYLYGFPATGSPATQTESADGTTWVQPAATHDLAQETIYAISHALHRGYTLLLPMSGASQPFDGVFGVFDGTTWATAFTLPTVTIGTDDYFPNLFLCSDQDATNFYIVANYYKGGGGVTSFILVWQVTIADYTMSRLGEGFLISTGAFGGMILGSQIASVAVFDNKIFVAGAHVSGGFYAARVWRIEAGGSAWTQDMTLGGSSNADNYSYQYARLCGHGRQLWASWRRFAGATNGAIFRKRDAETWSTIASGTAVLDDFYDPIYALGDTMYAWYTTGLAEGHSNDLYYTANAGATMTEIGAASVGPAYKTLTRAFKWAVDNKIYGAIGNNGTGFDIWQMSGATATRVFMNAGTDQLVYGLFGAAKAPTTPPVAAPFTPVAVSPADPILPPTLTLPGPLPDGTVAVLTSVSPKCYAYLVANQAVVVGGAYIDLGATIFDVGGMFGGEFYSKASFELRVPYGADGYYLVTGQIAWNNAAGTRGVFARIETNNIGTIARAYAEGNVTSGYVFCRLSALLYLPSGDNLRLIGDQKGPGSWTAIGGASYTFLHAIRIL